MWLPASSPSDRRNKENQVMIALEVLQLDVALIGLTWHASCLHDATC